MCASLRAATRLHEHGNPVDAEQVEASLFEQLEEGEQRVAALSKQEWFCWIPFRQQVELLLPVKRRPPKEPAPAASNVELLPLR